MCSKCSQTSSFNPCVSALLKRNTPSSVALFEFWLVRLLEVFDVLLTQLDLAGCNSFVSVVLLANF
jgi:hypothetical protein